MGDNTQLLRGYDTIFDTQQKRLIILLKKEKINVKLQLFRIR